MPLGSGQRLVEGAGLLCGNHQLCAGERVPLVPSWGSLCPPRWYAGPGEQERRPAAAGTATRMPGNGQCGNVSRRVNSVILRSGDTCRAVGPLTGKVRQCRSDHPALVSLNSGLVGGKENQMFRGTKKSGGVW